MKVLLFYLFALLLFSQVAQAFPLKSCAIGAQDIPSPTNYTAQSFSLEEEGASIKLVRYITWVDRIPLEFVVNNEIALSGNLYLISFDDNNILILNPHAATSIDRKWISNKNKLLRSNPDFQSPSTRTGVQAWEFFYSRSLRCWVGDFYPTNMTEITNIWLGFRHQRDDGPHHGWIELAKTNELAAPSTFIFEHFYIKSWLEHPEPDAAIQAGMPAIPSLKGEFTEAGFVLRAGFDAPGMILEETSLLGELAVWRPLSFPGGVSAPIPLADRQKYFRVRLGAQ